MIRSMQILINGLWQDIRDKYGLILEDGGQELEAPPYKSHRIEIPGSDGTMDLTEAVLGEVKYENRNQKLTFFVLPPFNLENLKTEIFNDLHGKDFDYRFTFDSGYTYHGRFSILGPTYNHRLDVAYFDFEIIADPYKTAQDYTFTADAAGGATFLLPCGRKSVSPIFQTSWDTDIIFEGITYRISKGTTRIRTLWLTQGTNEIYINSQPLGGNTTWQNLITRGITGTVFATSRVVDWRWGSAVPIEVRKVYINYARKDL